MVEPVALKHCYVVHANRTAALAGRHWLENKTFRTPPMAELDTSKPKFYALDMFPYPRSAC